MYKCDYIRFHIQFTLYFSASIATNSSNLAAHQTMPTLALQLAIQPSASEELRLHSILGETDASTATNAQRKHSSETDDIIQDAPHPQDEYFSLDINDTRNNPLFGADSCSNFVTHSDGSLNSLSDFDGACIATSHETQSSKDIEHTNDFQGATLSPRLEEDLDLASNFKHFEAETDKVVTEYTTIVVNKVISSEDGLNYDATDIAAEEDTIYTTIDHSGDYLPSTNPTGCDHSFNSSSNKSSPSQDIQNEFEKDFCSVKDVLFNDDEASANITNAQEIKPENKDLEDSNGVRITLNFDGDACSSLLRYNTEQGASIYYPPDETDCDLDVTTFDNVQIPTADNTDPPNRQIKIVGTTLTIDTSSPTTATYIHRDDERRQEDDRNAVTLEIDTSTSVI